MPSLRLPKPSFTPETPMNRAFQPDVNDVNDKKVVSL
nr:MAG TPA: hypothetical protein [Caudoviricetes sp.]